MAGALPGWTGLGLLSGRLLGWRQGWILPALALLLISYWSVQDGTGSYPWWDFSRSPVAEHPVGIGVSLALLAVGTLAFWMTPWRLRGLLRRS
ncbi:hypothetical protein [Streptomyces sp. ADI98-10]|uniref:hypothetical protein n=1 Tax=Streptomyces sp. ADI98-10 TaxID=1522763 RepID=UPI000F55906C|nr:hypothetical protein [Streptomyces sp. ADI98-10]